MDILDVLIRTHYNQSSLSVLTINYSDFHKNRVRYNINTTNKAKSKICII